MDERVTQRSSTSNAKFREVIAKFEWWRSRKTAAETLPEEPEKRIQERQAFELLEIQALEWLEAVLVRPKK